jgi:pimeloyl-ACP methyl ester carboxylesterase
MSTWSAKPPTRHGVSRRAMIGGAASLTAISMVDGWTPSAASAAPAAGRTPDGYGSVSTAPHLPADFTRTFRSRFIEAGGIRQHAVIGGAGPPLLLVHGWPENWYAWRFVMPALARDFTVIAVDQRGIGLTEITEDGYDTATLARDMVALMEALGHRRFAVVGHDTGLLIGYALAADHPELIARVALAEVPGPPGAVPSPPLFISDAANNRLWHIPFNRIDDELTVDLVRGREDVFFGYEFAIQAGGTPLPEYARRYYVDLFARSRRRLRASFGLYREWGTMLTQNGERKKTKLEMPVLGIGGKGSWGTAVADSMTSLATDVQGAVIQGAGHWVAEQAPEEVLAALTGFLAPYRRSPGSTPG